MHRRFTQSSGNVAEVTRAASGAAALLARRAPADRADLLASLAAAIEDHQDQLVAIAEQETALGTARLEGEVARTTGQLRLFADVLRDGSYLEATIDHADPTATPPRPDLRRQLVPLGPVAVFSASNFPFAFSVVGGDTASALAAGCPVVVKAHSGHPELSRKTAEVAQAALTEAGAPESALTLVEGREAGRELVVDPNIKAVGFTGSLAGGRALFDLAVGRDDPIPFYGELGSLNPVVISPGAAAARPAELAAGLQQSFTLGVGQFCTKPGLVFVPASADLSALLRDGIAGAIPARMLTSRMVESFRKGTTHLSASEGVELVAGSLTGNSADAAAPLVFSTTSDVLLNDPGRLLEEHFGPAVILVKYDSEDALRDAVDVLPGGLTATLHAEAHELEQFEWLLERFSEISGRVILNGWPTGVAVTWSMHHGGPWPATTNPLHTSVGATAIRRFLRPVTFQDVPPELLPLALREDNPWDLPRRLNGRTFG